MEHLVSFCKDEAYQCCIPEVESKIARVKEAQTKGIFAHILTACKVLLAVMLIPPFLNYAALQREGSLLQPEGEMYDIGWGQKLFLSCKGKGAPTVVLDAPTGMTSDAWTVVFEKLAKYTRVCMYDRAGVGFSDRPYYNSTEVDGTDSGRNYRNRWTPFTAERMVEDLHQLVSRSSDQPRPFLLVGAELGALIAQFYARMFEGEVMGLVLINPLTEDLFQQDKGIWIHNWYGHMVPSFQTIQLGAALGVTRLSLMLGYLQHPLHRAVSLPDDKYLMCYPKHLSSVVDEHYFINETFSQLRTAKKIKNIAKNISVTVITGNYYDEQMPGPLNKKLKRRYSLDGEVEQTAWEDSRRN
ncbi:YQJL-like protein [Mya arenaria]|uniref:YQJL-like protein n=1 Tax=Mya arenaria TaxID=6604 RepID=A0ABY7F4C2_MYAAR|nr:YQJL-like protein [Mya arenaria]